MDLELNAKHVLITGGSKGIGLASAQGFLREGAVVTLVARDQDRLAAARQALLAEFRHSSVGIQAADLQSATAAADAIDRAEAESGPIDILVNCAGAARRTPPDELTPQHWREAMDAKYFTYIHVIDPLVKRMAVRGAGVIVNVVGMGGKTPSNIHLAGGAANAALMLVTAGLASGYGAQGLRINAVNPAATLTDRLQEGIDAEARMSGLSGDEVRQCLSAHMPLRRLATPQEIADVIVFLSSARASYVSGAIVSMDGAAVPLVV
ncbi:MAG: SDR family oxidoreductase [Burkholderiaceae bacterium]|jgi:NAD(P)-dependent dehydrogenase (short-subunit alcohol dehydrogenase family)|nr:SDR family oxidoreductase [Burkholderiaceae bacterium]